MQENEMNGTTENEEQEGVSPLPSRIPERVSQGVAVPIVAVLTPYLISLGFRGEP